jgi:FkbM family methyltransferase
MFSQAKELTRRVFPSLWLTWRRLHRPESAERELRVLDRVVPRGGVSVDVGANWGLYTRELARLSRQVHAFEPSHEMASLLRRTAPGNVAVHELALSDRAGEADLVIPRVGRELVHSLASIDPDVVSNADEFALEPVSVRRLDSVICDGVGFVKVDVEGHELHVLQGASALIDRSRPAFLVEAEERHRPGATRSLFQFFHERGYDGFFIKNGDVLGVDQFEPGALQNAAALRPDGGRRRGLYYINNFFFFPHAQDGATLLRH